MFIAIQKRLKNERGLTLVELLAVVVILGIIAAIAVPNIGNLIENTKKDAKVAEGVQIINAAKVYSQSEKLTFTSNVANVTLSNLAPYLDNVSADETSYSVDVVKNGNKYVYFLKDHASVTLVDQADFDHDNNAGTALQKDTKASEAELLAY